MKHPRFTLKFFLTALYFLWSGLSFAQQQSIRGAVKDKETQKYLFKAYLKLSNSDSAWIDSTNSEGEFKFQHLNPGRYTIYVFAEGYKESAIPDIVLNAAKEAVLNIELETDIKSTGNVEITVKGNPSKTNNDMVLVSGRQFTIDQTNRYAGSFNDPSRMATNFAGVSATGGQRNDIVIRGNSPSGLLWRLDGIDIPNPNHFASQGATGGPVNILNNNNLANSDFITGAFPAEYGNALSGVFDLKMRNGNNQKREYLFQVGFNGFEFGAEGPINKKQGSSYMINYRYSTLGLMEKLGFNLTFSGVPFYQDLSFKFNFPKTKTGEWALQGIAGKSDISMLDKDKDSADLSFGFGEKVNLVNGSKMYAVILTNLQKYKKGYFKFMAANTYQNLFTTYDTLDAADKATTTYSENSYRQKGIVHAYINHNQSKKVTLRTGIIGTYFNAHLNDKFLNDSGFYQKLRDFSGDGLFAQFYTQAKYRITEDLMATAGVNASYIGFNNKSAIEPRASLRYSLNRRHSLSAGYGLHSQMQPLEIYFGQVYDFTENKYKNYNKNIGFSKSHQFVLGYDNQIAKNFRVKVDAYYQNLFDIPVSASNINQFSLLNFGADFGGLPSKDSLKNDGTGKNYGVEITIEKFYAKNYYFLVTTSLFNSTYIPSDGKTYNTAFNGNYVVNALAGYEFLMGKNKRNALAINLKTTVAGGRRYTPIDEASTLAKRQVEYDWSKAYEEQFKTYSRSDIRIAFKWNMKHIVQEWALDIQNALDELNPLNLTYDYAERKTKIQYQQGRLILMQYKLYF